MIEAIVDEPTIITRMLDRRAAAAPDPFAIFFHVAAVGCWKEVVLEMKADFEEIGIQPICGFLGSREDASWFEGQGFQIAYYSTNVEEFELPTLRELWRWCQANPNGAALYCHAKGSANPESKIHVIWRRLMMELLVKPCKTLLRRLIIADLVGIDWQDNPHYPHFSGNFWMARADWIKELRDPVEYQKGGGPDFVPHPWVRMCGELWIGSKNWHYVENLGCRNCPIWTDWILSEIDFPGHPFHEKPKPLSISIIIPTLGRSSLIRMVDSLVSQMEPQDELIIVADGPEAESKCLALNIGAVASQVKLTLLSSINPESCYGNHQRNVGWRMASGDVVWFCDDDDVAEPSAMKTIRQSLTEQLAPTMFRQIHHGRVIWDNHEIRFANCGAPQLVCPNTNDIPRFPVPAKNGPESDGEWMTAVQGEYPIRWSGSIIYLCDTHGAGKL